MAVQTAFCILALLLASCPPYLEATELQLNLKREINEVDDHYLSLCVDAYAFVPGAPWFDISPDSPKLNLILSSLSPAILRFGGTYSSFLVFDVNEKALNASQIHPKLYSMSKTQWDTMVTITRRNNMRLLFDLNAQRFYGVVWNPMSAIKLLTYSASKGYGDNIDWELGNEPEEYSRHELLELPPALVARGYNTLRKLLATYGEPFNTSRIVGPDVVAINNDRAQEIMTRYVDDTTTTTNAFTYHHYYLSAPTDFKEFIDPKTFKDLANAIKTVKKVIAGTTRRDIPLWMGEGGTATHSQTPAAMAYASGFLWMDKLGLSAAMGVKVLLRQSLYSKTDGLVNLKLEPAPDFWISVLYKKLVGTKVLEVETTPKSSAIRAYAHCANSRAYHDVDGPITLFAMNTAQHEEHVISLPAKMKHLDVHVYLLTPDGPTGVLSKDITLNGQKLEFTKEMTLPEFKPVVQKAKEGITIPGWTYGFFVVPKASAPACSHVTGHTTTLGTHTAKPRTTVLPRTTVESGKTTPAPGGTASGISAHIAVLSLSLGIALNAWK